MLLKDFIELVNNHTQEGSLEDFESTLKKTDIEIPDGLVEFTKEKYKRNLVFRNDNVEIFLLGWLPNQKTPFHNHPEKGCLMKILEGTLQESIMNCNGVITDFLRKKGDSSYIHDSLGTHQVINQNTKSISLHIYSPPNHYT